MHTEILFHDIKWTCDNDQIKELGEVDAEHIEYMIKEGFSSGELNISGTNNEDIGGWWEIIFLKDVACELYHATPDNTERGKAARKRFDEIWSKITGNE